MRVSCIKAAVTVMMCVFSLSCSKSSPYRTGKLSMLSAFSAKEMCSCLFVVGQSEAFCRAYVKQWPPVTLITVELNTREVTARSLLFYASRAKWMSQEYGCGLVGAEGRGAARDGH